MAEPYKSSFSYDNDGKLEEDKSDALSPFAGLCRVIGSFAFPRQYVGVSYENYRDGSTIFAVALDHEDTQGVVPGSFDVHIDFGNLTSEALMVILVGEYPKSIAFDSNRNISRV